MYTDYLPEPEYTSDYVEESNTAVLSSTLTFTPRPRHNGQLLGCRVYYPNTTLVYERLISLDVKYAPRSVWVNVSVEVMEGSSVTLHCEVDSNPPPRISWLFGDQELLWDTASNASLSLEDLTPAQDGIYTCEGHNGNGIMKNKNGNPGQDLFSKLEKPVMYYSTVKKDKQCLRKKVLKRASGLKVYLHSRGEYGKGEDGDDQPVGSMAALERQQLNYAALEFLGGRSRDGGAIGGGGGGGDGSDYTEIKAK
ncbi:unnamed protein product [Coregonus sp. 'balchen']|nr:unnamed protein product [Coregonus sp. 'balchen']